MNSYPEVVAKIANDYLERVKSQLRLVPIREQNEFLAEIESHLYEAYQQRPEEDDVARILAVLRNLGEPAEVVSDRLPRTMARSGTKRNLPLYVVGGILIAFFDRIRRFGQGVRPKLPQKNRADRFSRPYGIGDAVRARLARADS